MFKAIFWITFLCVFIHYADKIAYADARQEFNQCKTIMSNEMCVGMFGEVPLPPLEKILVWLYEYSSGESIEKNQTTTLPNSG